MGSAIARGWIRWWLALVLAGCGGRANLANESPSVGGGDNAGGAAGEAGAANVVEPPTGGFVVSDYYSPSAAYGGGAKVLQPSSSSKCQARPPGARGDCNRIELAYGDLGWAGVGFAYPANNWGALPGLPIAAGALTRVSFQASLETGTAAFDAVVGCLRGDEAQLPNSDSLCAKSELELTSEWQHIVIPLSSPDQSEPVAEAKLISALALITHSTDPASPILYIDDLVFE